MYNGGEHLVFSTRDFWGNEILLSNYLATLPISVLDMMQLVGDFFIVYIDYG